VKSGLLGLTIVLLLFSVKGAFAEEDLPAPSEEEAPPVASSPNTAPSTPAAAEDDAIPAPTLGDDSLPEASSDQGLENSQNQVNVPPVEDDVFLPTPNVNDNIRYAPATSGGGRSNEDYDWRSVLENRPAFSLYGGLGYKGYPTELVTTNNSSGVIVGASYRVINLAQTLFLHAYIDYAWYKLGQVGSMNLVSDETLHVGGMVEMAAGRHFSIIGSLLRRQAMVQSFKYQGSDAIEHNQNVADLGGIGEKPTWYFGLGVQWDFYVIPHGSVGLRAHLEQDLFSLTLAFAMEPAPPKKLDLNFNDNL
jgi:hypothetical protein